MRTLATILALCAALVAQDTPPAEKPAPDPVAVVKTSMGEFHVRLFAAEAPKTVENFLALAEGTKEFKDPKSGEMVTRPFYDGLVFHRVIKDFMIQGGCPLGDGTGDPGYRFEDEISARSLGLDKAKALDAGQPHPSLQVASQEDFQVKVIMPLIRKMGINSQAELERRYDEVSKKLQTAIPDLTVKEALENVGYEYDDTRESHAPNKGCLAMANSGPNTNGSQFFVNLADTPWLAGRHTVFGEVVKGMDVVEKIGHAKTDTMDKPLESVVITHITIQR